MRRPLEAGPPRQVTAALADQPFTLLMASDGGASGRFSILLSEPAQTDSLAPSDPRDPARLFRAFQGPGLTAGLSAYELADRYEGLGLARDPDWPDLTLARYEAALIWDHQTDQAYGCGVSPAEAERAAAWLEAPPSMPTAAPAGPLAEVGAVTSGADYAAAVTAVVEAIATGDLFQANIARSWHGRLIGAATPYHVFDRLMAASPAPFGAYWRFQDRALVSHSPELFLTVEAETRRVETRPIKGTRPRGADGPSDRALASDLVDSGKDRAENLMIVDLMRNDLARVCVPGSVAVPRLLKLERYPQVQHLVSTVTGTLAPGRDLAELWAATFPPGSITGAPKVQAMKTIAAHEPPRGPWCGSLLLADQAGGLVSSVLIRSAGLVRDHAGWRVRMQAGAGIVADSDPSAEVAETEVKIASLMRALTGG